MNIKHFVESALVNILFAGSTISMFVVFVTIAEGSALMTKAPWVIFMTFSAFLAAFVGLMAGWVDAVQTTNQLYRISRMEERRRHANYSRALYHMRDAVRDHDKEVQSWEQQVQLMGKRL